MSKAVYLLVAGVVLFAGGWFLLRGTVSSSQDGTPSATSTPAQGSVVVPTASSAPSTMATTTANTKPSAETLGYKEATTTLFWVGEGADASNDYIANHQSYWDEAWQEHYGGVDDPSCRSGYLPCDFTPMENPFYVALPYGEYNMQSGEPKPSARQVPWYQAGSSAPLLKNRWVEVRYRATTCYGQWEDVGPNEEDDVAYVFGKAPLPRNTFEARAGLDVSPALWKCLGLRGNSTTSWRFVDADAVPPGPWQEVVTTSAISWR